MLIKIADTKKAIEPSKDLPFHKGFPIFVPTTAAKLSDIIKINHDEIAKPLEKNKAVTKKPTAIKLLPLNLNDPLYSSGLISLPKNLSV